MWAALRKNLSFSWPAQAPPQPHSSFFLSQAAPTCLDTLSHQERPRGSNVKTSSLFFLVSQPLCPILSIQQMNTFRLNCQMLWFKANPTTLPLENFYFFIKQQWTRQHCSGRVGSESVHVARLSSQCLSQLFSFSRCWSSSPLACRSLPQLEPSQQPQLLPIWRPSKESFRRDERWEEDPSLKIAPRIRLGLKAWAGDKKSQHQAAFKGPSYLTTLLQYSTMPLLDESLKITF